MCLIYLILTAKNVAKSMDGSLYIVLILLVILLMVLEHWFTKSRSQKIKLLGEAIIPDYGFVKSNEGYSDYKRTVDSYAVSLTHIRKYNLFSKHSLILMIDYNAAVAFNQLNEFVAEQRLKHPEYQWAGNSIFKTFAFYRLSDQILHKIDQHLLSMIDVLKKDELEPILRKKGRQQGDAFDAWQMGK